VFAKPDATALGVAAFARLGAGDDEPTAVLAGAAPSAVYEPRIGAAEASERIARFRLALEAVAAE